MKPMTKAQTVAYMDFQMKYAGASERVFDNDVKEMIHEYLFHFKPLMEKLPLITGNDLINEFGLAPSPLFKTILNRVEQAMLAEKIKNRPEALKFVEDLLEIKNLYTE